LLNTAHRDFVDNSSDILVGRPYSGTAILYRQYLTGRISFADIRESRISEIHLETNIGPLLMLNVYMSSNYGDHKSRVIH